jgi:hypothetical protein
MRIAAGMFAVVMAASPSFAQDRRYTPYPQQEECPQGREIRAKNFYPTAMTDCQVLDADTAAENRKLKQRQVAAPATPPTPAVKQEDLRQFTASEASDLETQSLIQKEMVLNDACRGGSGDEEATQKSCAERDAVFSTLQSRGWCYGTEGQAGYQKSWQKCPSAEIVGGRTPPPSSNRVEFDPRAVIQRRLIDSAIDRAESCVHGMLLVNLYRGVRERDVLANAAAEKCGNDLMAYLDHVNPKYSDKATISAALIAYGYQQLDLIVARGE